jgi:ribonuclease BN (tRNA processing enzyme)
MKMTALGTGGMYSLKNFDTNFCVRRSGTDYRRVLLVDCGSRINMSLAAVGMSIDDVDAVYITHEHPDHAGGLPYLAYRSIWRSPRRNRIKLYATPELLERLWQQLEPSCFLFNSKRRYLGDYFNPVAVSPGNDALWGDIRMSVYPWDHVIGVSKNASELLSIRSYGVTLCDKDGIRVHYTGDIAPSNSCNLIEFVRHKCDVVFVDCDVTQTSSYDSVHMPYRVLSYFPQDVREKLRLVHYDDSVIKTVADGKGHPEIDDNWASKAAIDHMRFVEIHDTFDTVTIKDILQGKTDEE